MTVAQRSRAADTIARKGQTVTIAGTASGTYSPATGSTTNTAYSKTAKAVLLPLNPFRKTANSNIKEGDEQLLLAGLDTSGAVLPQPPINATVTLAGGSKKKLIAIDVLNPEGDGAILYDCIVRGAA